MKRKVDWPRLMAEAIESRRTAAFEWGKNDCVLFTADIVKAMTDVDMMEEWRGKYDDKESAHRLIAANGGFEAFVENVCENHGLTEINPNFAQRGDIAFFDTIPCVAIVTGAKSFAPAEDGLRSLKTRTAKKTWRVNFMSF